MGPGVFDVGKDLAQTAQKAQSSAVFSAEPYRFFV